MNLRVLTNIASNNSNVSWTAPSQQTTILDLTNPRFPRAVLISNNGVAVQRGANIVGVNMAVLCQACATVEPNLTWPPVIGTQPSNQNAAYTDGANSFNVAATSEVTNISYRWQISTDNTISWSNLSDTGVYSNTATNSLNISNDAGLHLSNYRVACVNASGTTNSNAAKLVVVPKITAQPANRNVAHPAATNFPMTAIGTANLSYQWALSIDGIVWGNTTDGVIYSGSTTNNLVISNTTGMNGSRYRVLVTDGNGQTNTSNQAFLTVT